MRNEFNERYVKAVNSIGGYENICGPNRPELSEADCFIEFCFEKACGQMKNGLSVLTEWRYHKEQYCKLMDTIIFDFGHYSRHDSSHSISILETIEMIIGDKRLVQLSRGDLWLLLESAYSHDIGMALTGEELCDLWKQEEFKEYLLKCITAGGMDMKEAAIYYVHMNDILMSTNKLSEYVQNKEKCIFDACWPAKITTYVKWLVAEYIRKQHGKRNMIVRKRIVTLENSEIPIRLYNVITIIAQLHGADCYGDILEQLEYKEKGIGAELIYPRFAAAMLRIGDVLDVENNRFSTYSVKNMIQMPTTSQIHLLKHQSISHIVITDEDIKLEAVSSDIEVCKCARQWFDLVDQETKELIYSWNEIAPPELCGCKLKRSICNVYYVNKRNNKAAYSIERQKYFEVNKEKLIGLLVGNNIYSQSLDFIREYLQNAMDATKMQMWKDISDGKYEDKIDSQLVRDGVLTPYDIPQEVYDRYTVKLNVNETREGYTNLNLVFEDFGIGMEKECIPVISNIGTGWRGRKKYNQIIKEMPFWLRPTGGFGIGIQSAFMVTSQVIVKTQTADELIGRKITLTGPGKSGEITVAEHQLGHGGTKIEINVPVQKFLEWNHIIKKGREGQVVNYGSVDDKELIKQDVFSIDCIKRHTKMVLNKYLEQIIPNPIIPIRVSVRGFQNFKLCENTAEKSSMNCQMESIDGRRYLYWKTEKEKRAITTIWDCKDATRVEIYDAYNEDLNRNAVYYKNVRMTETSVGEIPVSERLSINIDFMGLEAEKVLKIHRNDFVEGFPLDKYKVKYIGVWIHFALKEWIEILENNDDTDINKKALPSRDSLLIQMKYVRNEDLQDFKKLVSLLVTKYPDDYILEGWKVKVEKNQMNHDKEGEEQLKENEETYSVLTKTKIKWTLKDFYENKYVNYINGKDSFLVGTSKKENFNDIGIKLTDAMVNALLDVYNVGDDISGLFNSNSIKPKSILSKLLNDVVIYDDFLYRLYKGPERVEHFGYSVSLKENDKLVFVEVKRYREDEFETRCSLDELYDKSWDENNSHDFIKIFPKEYDCIAVNEVPYIGEEGKILIRPFSISKIKEHNERAQKDIVLEKKIISKEEFIEDIMGKDAENPSMYFGYLMQWVQDHAIEKEARKEKKAIWEGYRRYIADIYDVFKKKNNPIDK